MMPNKYTPEFNRKAVRMKTEYGLKVPELSRKFDMPEYPLYAGQTGPRE